ncbi:hypothetical protein VPH234P10_0050 [Vibrio phage 234P10]
MSTSFHRDILDFLQHNLATFINGANTYARF